MGKKIERSIDMLKQLGYKATDAKLLIYFIDKKQGTAREIERAMYMRQPEVSLGMKKLVKEKFVTVTKNFTEGKGRPELIYTVVPSARDMIIKKVDDKINKIIENIAELKRIREKINTELLDEFKSD